ncbi:MAG: deoxyribodipyrimidine photo-lyase/cryptochrome family protein [Paracoccaceae bacterium]
MRSRPLHVVWFTRDLRLFDHEPLARAAEAADGGVVVALYVAEPAMWAAPCASARQWRFVAAALADLDARRGEIGSRLVVRPGEPVAVLDDLHASRGLAGLWSHEETGEGWSFERDRAVAAWARAHAVPWREFRSGGVVRRLRSRDGWAEAFDRKAREPMHPAPRALAAHGLDPGRLPGERDLGLGFDPAREIEATPAAARDLLDGFLAHRGRRYRTEMSSPVTAFDACSRLSPHLSWGTISTREAVQHAEAARRCTAGDHRRSIDSFLARMHRRCHFKQKLEDEPMIEHRPMHPVYEGLRDHDAAAEERLQAWVAGETGLPMVDACMRALRATGWLNFRMRAMLASVAAYHLWLDWRRFGVPMGRLFTDFEPGIHWSQCQMQSGVTGINTIRIYNPVKQSTDHDPEGVFLRRWLPELEGFDTRSIHEPWRTSEAEQRAAGCVIGRDYPAPVVEPAKAARIAKERIYARRREAGFEEGKAAVLKRHASRKRPRREHAPRADAQASFDF